MIRKEIQTELDAIKKQALKDCAASGETSKDLLDLVKENTAKINAYEVPVTKEIKEQMNIFIDSFLNAEYTHVKCMYDMKMAGSVAGFARNWKKKPKALLYRDLQVIEALFGQFYWQSVDGALAMDEFMTALEPFFIDIELLVSYNNEVVFFNQKKFGKQELGLPEETPETEEK